MTRKNHSVRIISIAPATRGFGYTVMESDKGFVDWGINNITGDKNNRTLERLEELIRYFQPSVFVMEDYSAKSSRRRARIRALGPRITALMKKLEVKVVTFSREQVIQTYFGDKKGTKQEIAKIIAKRFPEELGPILPPKRKPWNSEDYQMRLFDAVGLALVFWLELEKSLCISRKISEAWPA